MSLQSLIQLHISKSGRNSAGLKVLRYASKIHLEVTIQESSRSKIYPPKLLIEYVEREVASLTSSSSYLDKLYFRVEYNMITTKVWERIRISIVFGAAIAFLIWIYRMYNWYARNRNRGPLLPELEGQSLLRNQFTFITHILMTGLHTIVLVFGFYLVSLCTFW